MNYIFNRFVRVNASSFLYPMLGLSHEELIFFELMKPDLMKYTNYREFLRDYYTVRKEVNPSFSFRSFSNRAGFKSKSFIREIITGRRNLSKDSIGKLNNVLKFTDRKLKYFETLVLYNQCDSHKLKNFYYDKLVITGGKQSIYTLNRDQHEFYSAWYHNTIREIITLVNFNEDFEALAKMLRPKISAKEAKKSVDLLLKLKLVEKTDEGYKQVDSNITTGDDIVSTAVHNFHHNNLKITQTALDKCAMVDRDISSLIVSLSEESFVRLKDEIRQFRRKVAKIADNSEKKEQVYHVNFQLFPTTDKVEGK